MISSDKHPTKIDDPLYSGRTNQKLATMTISPKHEQQLMSNSFRNEPNKCREIDELDRKVCDSAITYRTNRGNADRVSRKIAEESPDLQKNSLRGNVQKIIPKLTEHCQSGSRAHCPQFIAEVHRVGVSSAPLD
jgi:hypothetical protein